MNASSPAPDASVLAARKAAVVQAAIAQLEAEAQMYRDRIADVEAPTRELDDPTDRYDGHHGELTDEHELLNAQLTTTEADLVRLQQAEFQALYREVTPGAVVHLDNGLRLVVGLNLRPFEVDGSTYRSVTPDAPLYRELLGKQAGDTVTVQGQTVALAEVM